MHLILPPQAGGANSPLLSCVSWHTPLLGCCSYYSRLPHPLPMSEGLCLIPSWEFGAPGCGHADNYLPFIVPYTCPYKQEECLSLFSVNTRRYYDSSETLPLLSSFRVWRKYTSKHTTSKAQPPSPPWGYEPCSGKAKFMLTVTLAYCLLTGHMLSHLILECPIIHQLLLSASYR